MQDVDSSVFSLLIKYIKERAASISMRDVRFISFIGFGCALLVMPLFQNLGIFALLSQFDISIMWYVFALIVLAPAGLLLLAYCIVLLPLHAHSAGELSRYGVVGVFNTLLNAAIFNGLILVSGLTQGPLIVFFALVSFTIVIMQSFVWNTIWTFQHVVATDRKKQWLRFILVTTVTALGNLCIIHILVNVIGSPFGIAPKIWANIALLLTIVTALLGNFVGYKYFVFAK